MSKSHNKASHSDPLEVWPKKQATPLAARACGVGHYRRNVDDC